MDVRVFDKYMIINLLLYRPNQLNFLQYCCQTCDSMAEHFRNAFTALNSFILILKLYHSVNPTIYLFFPISILNFAKEFGLSWVLTTEHSLLIYSLLHFPRHLFQTSCLSVFSQFQLGPEYEDI